MKYKVLVIQYDDLLNGYCKEQNMSAENYYLNESKQFWKDIKKKMDYKKESDTIDLLILSDFDVDVTAYKQELLAEGFYFASKSNWSNEEIIEEADKRLAHTKRHVKVLFGKDKLGDGEIELRGISIVENELYEIREGEMKDNETKEEEIKNEETKDKKIKEEEIKDKEITEKQNQKLPENTKINQNQAPLAKLMKALTEGRNYDELQE